jgi:Dynein heavy chain C-terminal domain
MDSDLRQKDVEYYLLSGLLKNWAIALAQNGLYRNKLPLGVFLEPDILLNTLRQKTCRHLKKPLDELEILVTFGSANDQESPYSFLIGDLQLEGGIITPTGAVEAQNSDKSAQERCQIDSVTIGFVPKGSAALQFEGIELPIYLNANKEMMLMRVRVPYSGNKNEVILAGCSFYI